MQVVVEEQRCSLARLAFPKIAIASFAAVLKGVEIGGGEKEQRARLAEAEAAS